MKLLSLTAIAVAFSTLVGIQTASAISSESDAGGTSSVAPLTDPSDATDSSGSSSDGSGSFSIMVPDQQGDQLLFGTGSQPLLPSFPSDTSQ
jgi:hypothetical protein